VLERLAFGELATKHHLALRGVDGHLRYEECLTRQGFDGPYTILYHEHRPQALRAVGAPVRVPLGHDGMSAGAAGHRVEPARAGLYRHHYRTLQSSASDTTPQGGDPAPPGLIHSHVPLLHNRDVILSSFGLRCTDEAYRINARADELVFVLGGRGAVRSPMGDLLVAPGDYVLLPKGLLHRWVFEGNEAPHGLSMEFFGGVGVPSRFRNPVGQLRMDAPYSHRDFRRPDFRGPLDEGLREVWVKSGEELQRFVYPHSPLDVVGWDGSLYPWAFPILNFQPRVSSVHLPPTWHGTFEASGALICSFVPRPLDFHPDAVTCPYSHTSADVDEVLYYVEGEFSSRLGVGRGSLTLHPGGMPHGPHPGRYEASLGARRTDELAVMLDVSSRLIPTSHAHAIEDLDYEASFSDAALT
jgi:homogentisate 1,2-dioxygenase